VPDPEVPGGGRVCAGHASTGNQGSYNGGNREVRYNNNRESSQREYSGRHCLRWNHARNVECQCFIFINLAFCAACAPAEHQNRKNLGPRGGWGTAGARMSGEGGGVDLGTRIAKFWGLTFLGSHLVT
jgi:hypothetical protein